MDLYSKSEVIFYPNISILIDSFNFGDGIIRTKYKKNVIPSTIIGSEGINVNINSLDEYIGRSVSVITNNKEYNGIISKYEHGGPIEIKDDDRYMIIPKPESIVFDSDKDIKTICDISIKGPKYKNLIHNIRYAYLGITWINRAVGNYSYINKKLIITSRALIENKTDITYTFDKISFSDKLYSKPLTEDMENILYPENNEGNESYKNEFDNKFVLSPGGTFVNLFTSEHDADIFYDHELLEFNGNNVNNNVRKCLHVYPDKTINKIPSGSIVLYDNKNNWLGVGLIKDNNKHMIIRLGKGNVEIESKQKKNLVSKISYSVNIKNNNNFPVAVVIKKKNNNEIKMCEDCQCDKNFMGYMHWYIDVGPKEEIDTDINFDITL